MNAMEAWTGKPQKTHFLDSIWIYFFFPLPSVWCKTLKYLPMSVSKGSKLSVSKNTYCYPGSHRITEYLADFRTIA